MFPRYHRFIVVASFVAALMSNTSFALQPTDLATLGTLPHDSANALGTSLRVYRDLAYSTRDDLPDEGAGYVSHGRESGRHRSGTYFDVYVADTLFSSAAERAKMPVFLFLHGGSWSQAYDKDISCHELLRRTAAKGYFVISMDYQLQNDPFEAGATEARPNATYGDMLADVDTMVTYLKTALPAAGLPTDKIVIGGESAGGHLAMCYAWDQDAPGLPDVTLRHDLRLSCVTSVVGPTDLTEGKAFAFVFSPLAQFIPQMRSLAWLMCWLTGVNLLAMNRDQAAEIVRKWAPVALVKPSSCPAILAYGCEDATPRANSTDSIVPVSNFIGLTNRLASAGVPYDAQLFTRANHGNVGYNFDNGRNAAWVVDRLAAFKEKLFNELRIGEGTGQAVKPLNGLGGGPKTGWGVGKDGGIYSDSTPLYREIAPPFVRFHDIEAPFGRGQFFDVHIYMADKTPGHALFFEKSDAYVDTILAVAPQAKIIYRLGESIGATDDINPYAVKPADYGAWCTAAVEIAQHYVEKYKTVEWYFEIWNEANLTGNGCHTTFSSAPNAGDTCPASDYFELYEQLALALGELRRNGDYRNMKIGGPAESGIEKGDYSTFSCEEFLAELERYNTEHGCVVPLDFYSWHQYDGAAVVQPVADQVGRLLAATTHYRKTLNICDEWNLSVDRTKLRKIGLAEGAANTLATMIAWQDSALDAAVYYDAQLSGGFNGLWYKPYLEAMISNEQFIQEFTAAYRERGEAGITEAQRRFLASSADQPLITLGGYWAMRAFAAVAAHGETLRMERGTGVPASVYALASRGDSGGAIAIVNNAETPADIRVAAIPFPSPLSMTRVKGSSTPGAEVTPSVSAVGVSGGFIDLVLDPYEIVLLATGEGLQ